MNYIERIYSELVDLKGTVNILQIEMKEINSKFEDILIKIRETEFNVSQSVEMYKRLQEFLQERRLLRAQIEEMEVQYEILGGDEQLKKYEKALDFKEVKKDREFKKDKKYYRDKKYYNNFREDLKEKAIDLYHIV
ncbi:hypothetical protein PHAGE6E_105 [Staphylococcus phage 6ec]|uniref:Uncharacterized protein n=1 Tax=Staphylococcus phage 6ec TaxID=1500386 RepID=A0A060AF13_9CAUD|nr:hypothetical protein PHAGE6E_105 [Staphylococcus phage 6ec]AIA64131.1 hypothetical protein PHAGE6E_105 [Staphylococcus phage 6ec]